MTITIEMTLGKAEFSNFLKQLLSAPMDNTNRQCIEDSYVWSYACTETLGTLQRLRNRLAMSKTKSHLDNKNPAPVRAGNGMQKK